MSLVSLCMLLPMSTLQQLKGYYVIWKKPGRELPYTRSEALCIEAYTDAYWTGSVDDMISISGYCIYLEGNHMCGKVKGKLFVPYQVQK